MVKIRQAKASQLVSLINIKVKVLFKVKVNLKVKDRIMAFGTHMQFPLNLMKIVQAGVSEKKYSPKVMVKFIVMVKIKVKVKVKVKVMVIGFGTKTRFPANLFKIRKAGASQ